MALANQVHFVHLTLSTRHFDLVTGKLGATRGEHRRRLDY